MMTKSIQSLVSELCCLVILGLPTALLWMEIFSTQKWKALKVFSVSIEMQFENAVFMVPPTLRSSSATSMGTVRSSWLTAASRSSSTPSCWYLQMAPSLTCRQQQMRSWRLQGYLFPSLSLVLEILNLTKWTSLTLITNHFIPRVPGATRQGISYSLSLTEIIPMTQLCWLRRYSRKSQTSSSNTSKRKILSRIQPTHCLDSKKQLKQQWMPKSPQTSEVLEWQSPQKKTGTSNKNANWSNNASAAGSTPIKFEHS